MPRARGDLWWNPIEQIKQSTLAGLYGGRNGASSIPFVAIFQALQYSWRFHIKNVKAPRSAGLNVQITTSDAQGLAIYGVVRVSGTNVIPEVPHG